MTAWLAVDKDGTECIYADKKLIGRELTWKDEAVELKE